MSHAAVQARSVEGEEAVMPVEGGGSAVDGVDHDGSGAVVSGARDRPDERVLQQIRTQS